MSENSRKRRRLDPVEICQQAYDVIRNFKKEEGALLCDALIRAPKRRQEPAYYDVVSNPIDLLRIQQKIRTDEYEDLDQMTVDIELLVKNAKTFYPNNSTEYQDACTLWDLYQKTVDKINESERVDEVEVKPKERIVLKVGRPPKKPANSSPMDSDDAESEESRDTFSSSSHPVNDEDNIFEELFSGVMNATSSDGRLLHTVFQLLPSRKLYPDYYQVIENPIDLKQIAIKIQANEYSNLNEMEKDLNLLTKNACTYNEPGSQIYKDAKLLRKTVTSRKSEIEHSRHTGGKTSERIRYVDFLYRSYCSLNNNYIFVIEVSVPGQPSHYLQLRLHFSTKIRTMDLVTFLNLQTCLLKVYSFTTSSGNNLNKARIALSI